MADPEAKAILRADNRKLDRDLSKSKTKFKRAFMGIGSGIKNTLRGALSPIGAGLSIAGAISIGKDVLEVDRQLTAIQAQAALGGKEIDGLGASVKALSLEFGISRTKIAAGAKSLVDLKGASDTTLPTLAQLAKASIATGVSIEELTGINFALENSLGISSAQNFGLALDQIATAGARASVPIEQMSGFFRKSSAALSKWVPAGNDGVAVLSAIAQSGSRTFGTIEEVSTAATNLGLALTKLKTEGKVSGGSLVEFIEALQGQNLNERALSAKLLKLFPEKKVRTLVTELLILEKKGKQNFLEIAKSAKDGGDAISKSFDRIAKSDSFKVQQSLNKVKETLAEAFTPERIKLVVKGLEKAAKILGFVVDHAQELIILFAAIKLGGMVSQLSTILQLTGAAGIGGNVAKMGTDAAATTKSFSSMPGVLGKINAAVGVVGAALAGWQIGKMLDDWLGISDAISDLAIDETPLGEGQNLFLLQSIETLNKELAKVGGDISKLSPKGQVALTQVERGARERGIIDKEGKVDEGKAFELAGFDPRTAGGAAGIQLAKFGSRESEESIAGGQLIDVLNQLQKNGIKVDVIVDQQGNFKAEQRKDSEARKSPQ